MRLIGWKAVQNTMMISKPDFDRLLDGAPLRKPKPSKRSYTGISSLSKLPQPAKLN
jgi:hypothetical protein